MDELLIDVEFEWFNTKHELAACFWSLFNESGSVNELEIACDDKVSGNGVLFWGCRFGVVAWLEVAEATDSEDETLVEQPLEPSCWLDGNCEFCAALVSLFAAAIVFCWTISANVNFLLFQLLLLKEFKSSSLFCNDDVDDIRDELLCVWMKLDWSADCS